MVPSSAPRNSAVRSRIQSRNSGSRAASISAASIASKASQVAFSASHMSRVILVRTERAFVARAAQAGAHGRCVVVVEEDEVRSPSRRNPSPYFSRNVLQHAGAGQRRAPFVAVTVAGVGRQRDAEAGLGEARHVLRALDLARHPEQVFGGPSEHLSVSPRRTQVSLVPPPCEEFTTSDPFFSATRVSPPGTMRTRSPTST